MSTEWKRRRVCVDPVNGMVASDPGERLDVQLFNKGTGFLADMFDGVDRGQ